MKSGGGSSGKSSTPREALSARRAIKTKTFTHTCFIFSLWYLFRRGLTSVALRLGCLQGGGSLHSRLVALIEDSLVLSERTGARVYGLKHFSRFKSKRAYGT